MYLKSKLSWNVVIPSENLEAGGMMLQKAIITRIMADFAAKKATKDLGYFHALTTVGKIGEEKVRKQSGDVIFPVSFSCITFKIMPGEVLEGVVDNILMPGVFLKCGPVATIFLSHQKMDDYQYMPGENPYFMNGVGKGSKVLTDMVDGLEEPAFSVELRLKIVQHLRFLVLSVMSFTVLLQAYGTSKINGLIQYVCFMMAVTLSNLIELQCPSI